MDRNTIFHISEYNLTVDHLYNVYQDGQQIGVIPENNLKYFEDSVNPDPLSITLLLYRGEYGEDRVKWFDYKITTNILDEFNLLTKEQQRSTLSHLSGLASCAFL